jgi:hypothetical protein
MTDYTKTAARADASLRRKGGTVTLRRIVLGDYYPDSGQKETISDTTYAGTGVKVAYEASDIDGTLILATDQQMLLSPLQTNGAAMPEPKSGDTVTVGTSAFNVISVAKVEPFDVAVLFTLQLRGL